MLIDFIEKAKGRTAFHFEIKLGSKLRYTHMPKRHWSSTLEQFREKDEVMQ